MKLGTVVLHYRFWPGVRSTLEALLSQTRPPDDVVVVDNGSGDGSVADLRRGFPEIELIEAEANLGYGGGMNLGMKRLLEREVEAILLLTHECHLAPSALEVMVGRLENETSVGAVGPLLGYRSKPQLVFSAGGFIDRRWRTDHLREPRLVTEWTGRPPRTVEWLDGSALVLRASAIRATGKLDERYFLYFEDAEYLLRLRSFGWSVECVPAAVGWQEPGRMPTYLRNRNRLRFLARTAPKWHVVRETTRLAASVAKNGVFPNPAATPTQLRDRRRALLHFLTRHWGPDQSAALQRSAREANGASMKESGTFGIERRR
jgi:hypothetical protein